MTIWDLLAAAARRRVVTLLGILLTGLAVFWVTTVPEVYSSQVRVVLLPPVSSQSNGYAYTSESLIHLAGVVARQIRGSGDVAETVSGDVTLSGEGYREGYAVRHPNVGGQWKYEFDQPVLDVQAVGRSRAQAESQMAHALRLVESTLAELQDAEGSSAANRVRTSLSPPIPQLRVEGGSSARAVAATALTGVILTLGILGSLGPARGGSALVTAPLVTDLRSAALGSQPRSKSSRKSRARASQL